MHFLNSLGEFLNPYLSDISVALIACGLVVFGADINNLLRKLLRQQHFIVRTLAFIVLNAFGYGFVIIKLSPYLTRTLKDLDHGMMFAVVISSFVLIGLWAQRNRQI